MPWPKRRTLARVTAVLTCAALGVWIGWRYWHPPVVTGSDGRQRTDIPVSEAGIFAGSKFLPQRRAYLQNLDEYMRMKMAPATSGPVPAAASIYPVLAEQVVADPRNQVALAGLPDGAIKDLADRIAVVLCRASGMPIEEYETRVDADGSRLTIPSNLPDSDRAELGTGAVQQPEKIKAVFERLYGRIAASPTDPHRFVGWSITPQGFKVGLAFISTSQDDENVLFDRFTPSERDLFRGLLAQGSLVFHRCPSSWTDLAAKYKSLVRFEGVIVIEDGMHDRFPFWMAFFFDPGTKRWWFTNAYRMVSVRAVNLPLLIY